MGSFLVISLLKEESSEPDQKSVKSSSSFSGILRRKIENFWKSFLSSERPYLIKGPKIRREEITIIGYEGTRILISDKKNNLEEVIKKLIEDEGFTNVVVEKGMEKYVDPEMIIDGKIFMYLWIKEILRVLGKAQNIPRQKMKILVIDSQEVETIELLEQIKEDLNYLTIATYRPEYFTGYIQELYEEYGLMASVVKRPIEGQIEGNVVINLDEHQENNCRYIEKNAIYLDLSDIRGRESKILSRRKDVAYYNHIQLLEKDKIVDNAFLQAALCGKTTKTCRNNLEYWMEEEHISSLILKPEVLRLGKITGKY